jgi:hypothetical protein
MRAAPAITGMALKKSSPVGMSHSAALICFLLEFTLESPLIF